MDKDKQLKETFNVHLSLLDIGRVALELLSDKSRSVGRVLLGVVNPQPFVLPNHVREHPLDPTLELPIWREFEGLDEQLEPTEELPILWTAAELAEFDEIQLNDGPIDG